MGRWKEKKLNIISENRRASFCVVGETAVQPSKFTTRYESIIMEGDVQVVSEANEKQLALVGLLEKYSPENRETGVPYMEKNFHKTTVLRFEIVSMSGKSRK